MKDNLFNGERQTKDKDSLYKLVAEFESERIIHSCCLMSRFCKQLFVEAQHDITYPVLWIIMLLN
jgi:hypothetical protein